MVKRTTGNKYHNILEAAINVIAEHGYHNSQVSKIAREAGVADGTIYLYFKNKEDILISLFKEKMGEFTLAAQNELEEISNVHRKLAVLIEMHLKRLESNRNLARVLQVQLRQSDESIRRAIGPPLKEYFKIIEGIIEEGQKTKVFHEDMDVKLGRQIIFGAIDEIATSWVLSNKTYSLSAQIKPAYHVLARALSVDNNYPLEPFNKNDDERLFL